MASSIFDVLLPLSFSRGVRSSLTPQCKGQLRRQHVEPAVHANSVDEDEEFAARADAAIAEKGGLWAGPMNDKDEDREGEQGLESEEARPGGLTWIGAEASGKGPADSREEAELGLSGVEVGNLERSPLQAVWKMPRRSGWMTCCGASEVEGADEMRDLQSLLAMQGSEARTQAVHAAESEQHAPGRLGAVGGAGSRSSDAATAEVRAAERAVGHGPGTAGVPKSGGASSPNRSLGEDSCAHSVPAGSGGGDADDCHSSSEPEAAIEVGAVKNQRQALREEIYRAQRALFELRRCETGALEVIGNIGKGPPHRDSQSPSRQSDPEAGKAAVERCEPLKSALSKAEERFRMAHKARMKARGVRMYEDDEDDDDDELIT